MFKINLPGSLRVKKIILYILIIISIGVLIKVYTDNKKEEINYNNNTEIHMENK